MEKAAKVDWNKTLPFVVLLGGFFVQTVITVNYGASWRTNTDARLSSLEQNVSALVSSLQKDQEARMQDTQKSVGDKIQAATQLARLEERFVSMDNKLADIRDQLILIKKSP